MKTFDTHDIYLATALKLHGFKLITFKSNGKGRGSFVFEDREDRSRYVQEYFSGELMGSLKSYASTWKDLKSLLYEMQYEEGK
jgi:hypothetical protein